MRRKKKILVVDDEPDFLKFIKIRLECNNYKVITARDGRRALASIERNRPDAVLLDMLLPGLGGPAVIREIKRIDKNLPVFLMTAFAYDARFESGKQLGIAGFIDKISGIKKDIRKIKAIV